MIREITNEKELYKIISTNQIVVIDFYTTWCGPCKMMNPVIKNLSKEYPYIVFAKINCEEFPDSLKQCKVECYPTFHILVNGKIKKIIKGAEKNALEAEIKELYLKNLSK